MKDASDDRLASLLEVIGGEVESREQTEEQLGQRMIRAYELPTEVARCDTSSFSVYHQIEEGNEATSLLRFGHSKNHRPDLRQYRQLLGTLDPAGVPLVTVLSKPKFSPSSNAIESGITWLLRLTQKR